VYFIITVNFGVETVGRCLGLMVGVDLPQLRRGIAPEKLAAYPFSVVFITHYIDFYRLDISFVDMTCLQTL